MSVLTVAGKEFEIGPDPFEAGMELTLTDGQASQLNQVRKENIGNNLRKTVQEWTGSYEELLAKVQEKADSYEFGVRAAGTGESRDPTLVEARSIARQVIKNKIKEAGRPALSADALTEAVRMVLEGPQGATIKELAAKRVEEKKRAAEEVMATVDLSGLTGAAPVEQQA